MIDMVMTPEDRRDDMPCAIGMGSEPMYPPGLAISFNQSVLDKLDVDHDDWEVGDIFPFHGLIRITSKTQNETTDGIKNRVELQITALGSEDEDGDDDDNDILRPAKIMEKRYGK
jgi:hypothetical protein